MYLVQRCTPKVKVYTNQKVSDYMSLDYMGSAEFEFGAIPKSIRKLANKKDLTTSQFKCKNGKGHSFTVHVLASEAEMPQAIEAILGYVNGKSPYRQLKEYIHFWDIVHESEERRDHWETFWWCVDENCNIRTASEASAEKNKIAMSDPLPNFAWSLDPEQVRCFKLALGKSLEHMNAQ